MLSDDLLPRREFFGLLSFAALVSKGLLADDEKSGDMIYRKLGKTGERVSAIGMGGYHVGMARDEQESIRLVRAAIDRGITFMDNCWDYMDGKCEIWMGKALRDGYRNKVFLMTKFDGRTRAAAARQIDESLGRLQSDHVDLMQFHENIRMEDPDRFFNEGVVDALLDAKKAGKIRYIGFTGHKDPVVHLRMLEVAQAHDFHFDTAQMPLNILDAQFRSFAHQVVPKLVEQGIAVLGMKPMAAGNIPQRGLATGVECLHYALNLPTSVVITGMADQKMLDQAFEAARTFKPLTQNQLSALLAKTRDAALSGKLETFKTTTQQDATARRPQLMG
ncbi:MAG TPA: aldo/keto reductase [Candidatus Sulfopaludibacter sp.]|nr:aldo/keto reductase [Candidatus Sulfopaludibacter sp.]